MPSASNYTNKIRFSASVKNTKAQLIGGVGNLTQASAAGCGLNIRYESIDYVQPCLCTKNPPPIGSSPPPTALYITTLAYSPGLQFYGISVDSYDNVYAASPLNSTIQRLSKNSPVTTIAGTGTAGFSGDGGDATLAQLNQPYSVALDSFGNIYIADTGNHRIRKIDASNRRITTVVGDGTPGHYGDGDRAEYARLSSPTGITVDRYNNIYIADTENYRIRKIRAATGIITTIAGTGVEGFSGDGGPALDAQISTVAGLSVDSLQNVYFADVTNSRIRRIDALSGFIKTVAGNGNAEYGGDNGIATEAGIYGATNVILDSYRNIYISDSSNNRIRKVDASTGTITTISGTGVGGYYGDGGLSTLARMNTPYGLGFDLSGNIFVTEIGNYRVRKLYYSDSPPRLYITTFVTFPAGYIYGIALDSSNNFYFASPNRNYIKKINAVDGTIVTLAGTGDQGYSGDGGPANEATFNDCHDIAFDSYGDLYIADSRNHCIRKITISNGTITTIAGNGFLGYSGDGGSAGAARLNYPRGVTFDSVGDLYIADTDNSCIRKITMSSGIITTIAGTGVEGFSGDGGDATLARLNQPHNTAVDSDGNVYISDTYNNRIRKITASTGKISTILGNGTEASTGDGGLATFATISRPKYIARDYIGNIYVVDGRGMRIRKIDVSTGIINGVAGTGVEGFSGDGGPALDARFYTPYALLIDAYENIFLSDVNNYRIRKLYYP